VNEEAGFLKAIADNPDDDTARLAFADWLEERDDARGPWVRDKDIWVWMKPDARDPTEKVLAGVRKGQSHAVNALQKMGAGVVPAILAELREAKPRTASLLYYSLGQIGPTAEAQLPRLLDAARDPITQVQIGAIDCLGGLVKRSEDARQRVIDALSESDETVRSHAVSALGAVGPEGVAAIPRLLALARQAKRGTFDSTAWNALGVIGGMGKAAACAIPDLVSMLSNDDIGNNAIYALKQIGVNAVRPLLGASKDFTENAIWRAVEVLKGIGAEAIPLLNEARASPHHTTRHIVTDALLQLTSIPEPESFALIAESLRSPDRATRVRILYQLQRLGEAALPTLPTLLEVLADKNTPAEHRDGVAGVIGYLGPGAESAIPALRDIVRKAEWPLSQSAGYSLFRLGRGPDAVLLLLDASRRQRSHYDTVAQILYNLSHRAVGDLAGVYDVVLPTYRERTKTSTIITPATLAVSKQTKKTVPAICAFLQDKSVATRVVAVWALRHVGTPEAVTGLLIAIKDKDKLVRTHAVRALGRTGKGMENVIEAVRAMLKDRATDVRTAAEEILEGLKPERP
jgi:uncharacterized protein (TIGR02996 family)